jgi:hypothetical protein
MDFGVFQSKNRRMQNAAETVCTTVNRYVEKVATTLVHVKQRDVRNSTPILIFILGSIEGACESANIDGETMILSILVYFKLFYGMSFAESLQFLDFQSPLISAEHYAANKNTAKQIIKSFIKTNSIDADDIKRISLIT